MLFKSRSQIFRDCASTHLFVVVFLTYLSVITHSVKCGESRADCNHLPSRSCRFICCGGSLDTRIESILNNRIVFHKSNGFADVDIHTILKLRGGSKLAEEDESTLEEQLVWSARSGDVAELERLLDTGMVNVNWAEPHTGSTSLHMAAANGHSDCVEMLLRAGADATIANTQGNLPLHWAVENRHAAAARRLLEAPGADVLLRNSFGKSALTMAVQTGDDDLANTVRGEHRVGRRGGSARQPAGRRLERNKDAGERGWGGGGGRGGGGGSQRHGRPCHE
jgi:hypothetical protein